MHDLSTIMHDLSTIRSGDFGHPTSPAGIAFLHLGFRTIWKSQSSGRLAYASHFPALGLLSLGQSLRQAAAVGEIDLPSMRYFDEEDYDSLEEVRAAIVEWLAPFSRRIVAASCYSVSVGVLEEFFSGLDPEKHLLLVGGAHPTVAPDFASAHIAVRGEGAAALTHILRTAFTPEFYEAADSKGMCFVSGESRVASIPAFDRSLRKLPSPAFAYDLHRPERVPRYWTHFTRAVGPEPQIYICTQSCRARCSFCSTYLIHGKQVCRPAALVRQDLHRIVHDDGYQSLEFHDDDLLQHQELDDVLGAVADTGVPWFCYGRVDTLDGKMAARLASAGCRRIFLGLESMEQRTLEYFNKATTVEQNVAALEACRDAGIGAIGAFIIGAPHHTVRSILADLDRYLGLPLFALRASILSPDIGTREFRRAVRGKSPNLARLRIRGSGKTLGVSPDPAEFGTATPYGMPTVCEEVSKLVLNELQDLIFCEFYLRGSVAERLFRETPEWYHETIERYYRGLLQKTGELAADATEPTVQERAQGLRSTTGFSALERAHATPHER